MRSLYIINRFGSNLRDTFWLKGEGEEKKKEGKMLPVIIALPQRNFLHLRTVASSLQQLKAILKDALAISDATSVEMYHENWTLVSDEEYTYLSPHTTLLAVTGKQC